jgi:phenylalanine-4-hydroxylase
MGTAEYDITAYQPVLYRADSTEELMDVVGGFFTSATDETIAALSRSAAYH